MVVDVRFLDNYLRLKNIEGFCSIGSCRTYEPLKLSNVKLDQKIVYCYTHNTREHLQLLTMACEKIPSCHFLSKVTGIPLEFAWRKGDHQDNIFYVIEISSIRVLKHKNYYLQINKFTNAVSSHYGINSTPLSFTTPESFKKTLSTVENFPLKINEIEYYEQDEDELLGDILKIQQILEGRVIFISHFNISKGGELAPQRQIIQKSLHKAHRLFGIKFFDPTDCVLAHGFQNACIDKSHYKEDFIPVMSEEIIRAIVNSIQN